MRETVFPPASLAKMRPALKVLRVVAALVTQWTRAQASIAVLIVSVATENAFSAALM